MPDGTLRGRAAAPRPTVPGAEAMATDPFDSVEDAATAYAYLVGFLV
jgi:hypothetical protein